MMVALALVVLAVGVVAIYFGLGMVLHDPYPLDPDVPLRCYLRPTRRQRVFSSWATADRAIRGVLLVIIGAAGLIGALGTLIQEVVDAAT